MIDINREFIMSKWNKCASLIFLIALEISSSYAENTVGMALYSKLGVPQYLVSLSVREGVNSEGYDSPQNMAFIVIPNRLSKRSWRDQWNRNIIINLEDDLNEEVQKLVDRLLNFPEGKLTIGDKIIFQYFPQGETVVSFNGHKLFRTKEKDFYKAIKSSMLGKFPPSRRFKSDLLGVTISEYDFSEYQKLKPTVERASQVKDWMVTPEKKEDIAKKKALEAANKEKERMLALSIKLKQQERDNNRKELERKRLLEKNKAAALKKEQDLIKKKKDNEAWRAKKAKLLAEKKKKEKNFALDMYKYQVTEMLYKRVQYPTWARKFEIEGVVDFTAQITTDGVIVDIVQRNSKTNKKLVKEVESKLKDVVSFMPMPIKHINNTFSIDIQYTFDLRKEAKNPNAKPKLI